MKLLADIASCISFYTRLPSGRLVPDRHSFIDSQWAAPIAGLLIGCLAGVAFSVARGLGFEAPIAAAITIASTLILTGALHEDGAADAADGLSGGTDRQERLAIMRDSRIGTYGALVLVLSIVTRWAALSGTGTITTAFISLLIAHTGSRALIPLLMYRLPPARSDGLSASAGRPGGAVAATALAFGGLALLPLGAFSLVVAIVLFLWWLWLTHVSENRIGGQTGDVLGALQQGAEVILLVASANWLAHSWGGS